MKYKLIFACTIWTLREKEISFCIILLMCKNHSLYIKYFMVLFSNQMCKKIFEEEIWNSEYKCALPVLQIRVCQQSITANLWPLTTHIHHIMIIVTGGISKKSFLSFSEAAVCRCSSKQVLLEILQYSQENICVGVSF